MCYLLCHVGWPPCMRDYLAVNKDLVAPEKKNLGAAFLPFRSLPASIWNLEQYSAMVMSTLGM